MAYKNPNRLDGQQHSYELPLWECDWSLDLSICLWILSRCKQVVNVQYMTNVVKELCGKTLSVVGTLIFRRTMTKHPFVYKCLGLFGSGGTFQSYWLGKFRDLVADEQQVLVPRGVLATLPSTSNRYWFQRRCCWKKLQLLNSFT